MDKEQHAFALHHSAGDISTVPGHSDVTAVALAGFAASPAFANVTPEGIAQGAWEAASEIINRRMTLKK